MHLFIHPSIHLFEVLEIEARISCMGCKHCATKLYSLTHTVCVCVCVHVYAHAHNIRLAL